MKQDLERFISEHADDEGASNAVAEAERLLLELIRLEGRVRRLANAEAGGGQAAPDDDLRGLPLHEAARNVLAAEGRPMHARELGVRIKARGWRHPRGEPANPDQIVNQLAARLPRYPAVFRRIAPQTFALVEWGNLEPRPPKPRLGVFSGPGTAVSEWIGEHPEAPFEDAQR